MNFAHRVFAGLLRTFTRLHRHNHSKGTHGANNFFAVARSGGRSDLAVDVQPRTDDGRIAHAAVHLECHSAGGAAAGKPTLGVERQLPNGVVVFDVGNCLILGLFEPLLPLGFALSHQEILQWESLFPSELGCAVANEHHVRSALHYRPSQTRNVHDLLACSHRTDVAKVVHNACIKGHAAVAVGASA